MTSPYGAFESARRINMVMRVALGMAALGMCACVGSRNQDDDGCVVGSERCACNPDGTCDGQLDCLSRLCVDTGGNRKGDSGEDNDEDGLPGNGGGNGEAAENEDGGSSDGGWTDPQFNPTCGDGIASHGEACDDGNQVTETIADCIYDGGPCTACAGDCTIALRFDPSCGDGTVSHGETCDDGQNDGGQGECLPGCGGLQSCGDGLRDGTEVCDDDFTDACGTCNGDCSGPGAGSTCGDGIRCPETEPCDDGGTLAGDGCTPVCMLDPQIARGRGHTCALQDNGSVKCWGQNDLGMLGLGDENHRGDEPGEMGDNLPAVRLGAGRTTKAIDAGFGYTCALLDDDTMKCWGWNLYGVLGQGDENNRGGDPNEMGDALPPIDLGSGRFAKAIAAGRWHICALLDDDAMKCWGENGFGALGLGDAEHRGDGLGEMGDNLPIVRLGAGRTAKAMTAGQTHTCALLDDGTVKCWGGNTYGQLGLGDTERRGDDPGESAEYLPTVQLGTGRTAKAIAASWDHTCALLDDDTVKCWGYNAGGQLGLGDINDRGDDPNEMGDQLPIVQLGTGRTAKAIAVGSNHTCGLLDDDTIKCWGSNGEGSLGLGDTDRRGDGPGEMGDNLPIVQLGTGRIATAIEAGSGGVTCALLDDSTIKCWGHNRWGQLGQGDSNNRGDDPGEMGDNLPAIDLGL